MKYSGMTVNERLYAAGLLDAFERSINSRDHTEAVRILKQVELESDAEAIVGAIEKDPATYGFPH